MSLYGRLALRGAPWWMSALVILSHGAAGGTRWPLVLGDLMHPPTPPEACSPAAAHVDTHSTGGMDPFSIAWAVVFPDDPPREEPELEPPEPGGRPQGAAPCSVHVWPAVALLLCVPGALGVVLLPSLLFGEPRGGWLLLNTAMLWAVGFSALCAALQEYWALGHLAWCLGLHSFALGGYSLATALHDEPGGQEGEELSWCSLRGKGRWSTEVAQPAAVLVHSPGAGRAAMAVTVAGGCYAVSVTGVNACYDPPRFLLCHLVAILAVDALRHPMWATGLVLGCTMAEEARPLRGGRH